MYWACGHAIKSKSGFLSDRRLSDSIVHESVIEGRRKS
jgi:hypothetical protein